MNEYITNFSIAEYFGCDGAPPESGPWKAWIEGTDPLVGTDFAEFLWWHLCEAMWLFLEVDLEARGVPRHTAESFERSINECLALAESHIGAPLPLQNPFYFDTDVHDGYDNSGRMQILLLLAYCVWCVDQLIDALRAGNAPRSALASAIVFRGLQLVHEYRDDFPEIKRRAESQRQSEIAKQRHANSPKARDIEIVKECWREWQRTPSNYRSKAAFAVDMLSKCEHLQSVKYIEDLCRRWEKESPKNAGRLRIVPVK